jgi:hypothetical protein
MFTFTVTRAPGDNVNLPITVNFTVGGTATYPTDYTVSGATSFSATAGSISIPSGQISASFTAVPVPDSVPESNETIVLTPQAQAGVFVIGAGSNWTATIFNDDGGDPFFANVVFLMLPVGADNSTAFVDSSSYARIITTVGDTKILSNRAVFDGAGDRLTIPSSTSLAMGSSGFCFETEVQTSQTTAYAAFLTRGNAGFGSGSWSFLISPSGKFNVWFADYSISSPLLVSTTTINDGVSRHIAWDRSSAGVHRLFVNGVQEDTVTTSAAMPDAGTVLCVSDDLVFGGRTYNGNNSVIRITSASRYAANFTPPTFYPTN